MAGRPPDHRVMSMLRECLFWKSERVRIETPGWIGHIPFGFWLVDTLRPRLLVELGTHYGNSYFTFCQAVERLGLDTKTFAIDTWRGDEHASFYGEEVYEDVEAWNSNHYKRFSSLLRMTFDDAQRSFANGSIDLLHIDGLHTYEAVKHDFENWLPMMSDRGVVLFHDTVESKDDFGVHRLWEEVERQYPTLAFRHSHGLGVACVGSQVPVAIAPAVDSTNEDLQTELRALAEALGDRILAQATLASQAVLVEELQAEADRGLRVIGDLRAEASDRLKTIQDLSETRAQLQSDVNGLKAKLKKVEQLLDAERARRNEVEQWVRLSRVASFALRKVLPRE